MVVVGPYRAHSELRKSKRQPIQLKATIAAGNKTTPRECTVENISETGAKLLVKPGDDPIADEFTLLLTSNGRLRRRCRVVWRDGMRLGVQFYRGEAAKLL